jgi:hypothetical protein
VKGFYIYIVLYLIQPWIFTKVKEAGMIYQTSGSIIVKLEALKSPEALRFSFWSV